MLVEVFYDELDSPGITCLVQRRPHRSMYLLRQRNERQPPCNDVYPHPFLREPYTGDRATRIVRGGRDRTPAAG